jgi:hypothetical protein
VVWQSPSQLRKTGVDTVGPALEAIFGDFEAAVFLNGAAVSLLAKR